MVIVILILVVIFLAAIGSYGSFLIKKYSKKRKMAEYVYNKIKEKLKNYDFLAQSNTPDVVLLDHYFFEMIYSADCVSNEEKIKNKLLNLQDNIKYCILISYRNGDFRFNIILRNIEKIVYQHFFVFEIYNKNNINTILKELEKIETVRNSVLYLRKQTDFFIEKNIEEKINNYINKIKNNLKDISPESI